MTTNNQQVDDIRDEIDDFVWHIENDNKAYHEDAKRNLKSAIDFYITSQLTLKDEQHARKLELVKIETAKEMHNIIRNSPDPRKDIYKYISDLEVDNEDLELLNENN